MNFDYDQNPDRALNDREGLLIAQERGEYVHATVSRPHYIAPANYRGPFDVFSTEQDTLIASEITDLEDALAISTIAYDKADSIDEIIVIIDFEGELL